MKQYTFDFIDISVPEILLQSMFRFLIEVDNITLLRTNMHRNHMRQLNQQFKTLTTQHSASAVKQLFQNDGNYSYYPLIRYCKKTFYEENTWLIRPHRLLPHHVLHHQCAYDVHRVYSGRDTLQHNTSKEMSTNETNYESKRVQQFSIHHQHSTLRLLRKYIETYAMFEHVQRSRKLCHKHHLDAHMVMSSFRRANAKIFINLFRPQSSYYVHDNYHPSNCCNALCIVAKQHMCVLHELRSNVQRCCFPSCSQCGVHFSRRRQSVSPHWLCSVHNAFSKSFHQIIRPSTSQLLSLQKQHMSTHVSSLSFIS